MAEVVSVWWVKAVGCGVFFPGKMRTSSAIEIKLGARLHDLKSHAIQLLNATAAARLYTMFGVRSFYMADLLLNNSNDHLLPRYTPSRARVGGKTILPETRVRASCI